MKSSRQTSLRSLAAELCLWNLLHNAHYEKSMKITDGGLDDPRVQKLLAHHLNTARGDGARQRTRA
ncbi:MAG TPA: hypothetical protein VG146_18135 [Verrucomicrobiae bacterium]|nr:hypothetical protein [Verrucomicrobiae bacterium]